MSKNFTLIINTCEKFSDIWETNLFLLNKNWPNRECETILLSDSKNNFVYENVKFVSAGENLDLADRLKKVLKEVVTDYIFISLDDYLLVDEVSNEQIIKIVDEMEELSLDYVRLYKYPKSRKTISVPSDKYLKILTFDKRYDVNLYPGIWKKTFLESALNVGNLNAWQLEVSLTKTAIEINAKCGLYKKDVFPIVDTIRKGKFLRGPYKFVKKLGLYKGDRQLISKKEEIKLNALRFINTYLPNWFRRCLKKIGRKNGVNFFSED